MMNGIAESPQMKKTSWKKPSGSADASKTVKAKLQNADWLSLLTALHSWMLRIEVRI